jgi:hypothetical protein
MKFQKSPIKNKKYRVITPKGNIIDFGDTRYEHYKDTTPLKLYKNLDHNDKYRKDLYLKRAKKIRDINGNLTYNNQERANYYSINYLWK